MRAQALPVSSPGQPFRGAGTRSTGSCSLRVPSATHSTGDDGPCGPLVRGERNPVSIRSRRRYEVAAML